MISKINKKDIREKRHQRIRNKINGTPERPRLAVFRSNANIYVQIIDDEAGKTLCAASSLDKDLSAQVAEMTKTEAAKAVGEKIAKLAQSNNIEEVVFDRGGFLYHGRVKALADGAREAGLKL
jgi:large subunit ribosomal protein L18